MSKWDDAFEEHPVHALLKNLSDKIGAYRGNTAEGEDQVEHVMGAVRFAIRRLNASDPHLATPAALSAIQSNANACSASLDQYASSKDESYWTQADSHADALVQAALLLPGIVSKADVEGVQEAVIRFRRSAGQHLRKLNERASQLSKKMDALEKATGTHEANLTAQVTRLDTAIQTFIANSMSAENERAAATTSAEENRGSEFTEAMASMRSEVETFLSRSDVELTAKHRAAKSDFDKVVGDQKEAGANVLTVLEQLKESARESVGIIAATGMAGGYEKTANEEKAAADLWRRVAIGAFIGIILFAVLLVFWPLVTNRDLTWQSFAAKAYASLTFALLAAYAGREAEKHRRAERYNRQRSLELRSLNPYLEPLPQEQQAAVRSVVADRIFGRDDLNANEPNEGTSPLPTVLEALAMLVKK